MIGRPLGGRPLSGRPLSGRSLGGSQVGRAGGGGAAFSPLSLGPTAFWLPASTVSSGTVADLTSNAFHLTQGTAGRRPTFTASGPRRLTFDGTDDCLEIPFGVCTALSAGNACSLVMGYRGTALNSGIRLQPGASEYIILGFDGGGGPQFIISTDGGTTGVALTGSESGSTVHLAGVWTRNTATTGMRGYVNNVVTAQRTSLDVALPTFENNFAAAVGAYMGGGTPAELITGDITHAIVFSRALSAGEVSALYTWSLGLP